MYAVFNQGKFGTTITANKLSARFRRSWSKVSIWELVLIPEIHTLKYSHNEFESSVTQEESYTIQLVQ